MTENYFDIGAAQDIVRQSMNPTDAVVLPFFAPVFYWTRGRPNIPEQQSGVQHFGGWQTDAVRLEEELGGDIPFERLIRETIVTGDGESYDAYVCRYLIVATIGRRFRLTKRTLPDGSLDPQDKGRGHLQVLAYSTGFDKDNKAYIPWLPVVLSAKGMSANSLDKVLKKWQKVTAEARVQAGKVSSDFFWNRLGTFGKEVKKETVGKKGAQNYITPIQLMLPDKIDLDFLKKVFVGKEIAEKMGQCAEQAQEWLHAWDKLRGTRGDKTAPNEPESPTDAPPDQTDDEAPF